MLSHLAAVSTLLALFASEGGAHAQSPFTLGPFTAASGTVARERLAVPSGSDASTFIPVTIVHGAKPGPVLAIIAGVHGSETTPIVALQRLVSQLDPARLSGTVVAVHTANVPSFLGRTVYVSPVDGKNLNRQFPGRADGTQTERIAHVLTTEIISRADVVIDVHSGDANEDLRPWTGFYAKYGSPALIEESRRMALAFGLDYIVEFPFVPERAERTVYTGPTALARGKPSFDVEVGARGVLDETNLRTVVDGLMSVMRHLQMLPGQPARTRSPWFITERAFVSAPDDGMFFPDVRAGDHVTRGDRLGRLTDLYGRPQPDVLAPATGAVLVIIATPAINKGDTLAVVAVSHSAP